MEARAFLERIRSRLQRDAENSKPIPAAGASPGSAELRPVRAPAEVGDAETFLSAWRAEGGKSTITRTAGLVAEIIRQAELRGVVRAVLWGAEEHPILHEVAEAFRDHGLEAELTTRLRGDQLRTYSASAQLGVVVAWRAIVASGTVVVEGLPGQERMVGLLPPSLFIIVARSSIQPSLRDVLSELSQRNAAGTLPQNVSLITGPSKSADIGLELVTNVHGPGDVHAFVVENN